MTGEIDGAPAGTNLLMMLASMPPEGRFQIIFFAEDAKTVLSTRSEEWFTRSDRDTVNQMISAINTVVPQGSANMERAFTVVRRMHELLDSIVLLTDGLPTKSDSWLSDPSLDITEEQRTRFFQVAIQQLPPRIPVSTIMFPFVGDFAGPKAIRAVGQYLKEHESTLSVFYLSNVEQYLSPPDVLRSFYGNVAELPLTPESTFIRSAQGSGWNRHRLGRPVAAQLDPAEQRLDPLAPLPTRTVADPRGPPGEGLCQDDRRAAAASEELRGLNRPGRR